MSGIGRGRPSARDSRTTALWEPGSPSSGTSARSTGGSSISTSSSNTTPSGWNERAPRSRDSARNTAAAGLAIGPGTPACSVGSCALSARSISERSATRGGCPPLAPPNRSGHDAQMSERLAAQLAHDGVDEPLLVADLAVGHRVDQAALALQQLGHRLIDRVRREQVPSGNRALLADPVQAVLGLVVAGGRPVQLEERDVGGARERDALRGRLHRADDQLRPVLALERVDSALAGLRRVRAEDVHRLWEALDDRLLRRDVLGEDDQRLAGLEEVGDPGERRWQLATRRELAQAVEPHELLGAQ